MYFYCSQTLGKASQKQLCNKIRIQSLENRCCLALFVGQAAFVKWYLDGSFTGRQTNERDLEHTFGYSSQNHQGQCFNLKLTHVRDQDQGAGDKRIP